MDEITFLTATVQRLDDEIARLNAARASLLRRLNEIRPISRQLPPETLATIFEHAAQHTAHPVDIYPSKKPARCSPLLLGSVCSHWREIAWTTPVLWTYIEPTPIRRNAQQSDAHLLRLYFTNARALPVHLHIKLDRLSSSPSVASEEVLRAAFIENSHKIGVLVCTSKSSLRQRWAMLAPKLAHSHFPSLRRLEINLRGPPLARYDSPMFVHAPALSAVSFAGYHLPHESFWNQITVLEFSALPVSQCLESLVSCPMLQQFRCTSPRQSHRPLDLAHPIISLEHLTRFEWVGALAEWDVFLYSYVRLPNLKHLVLGNSHPLSRPLDPGGPLPAGQQRRTTDPELWKRFLRHIRSLHTLECTVFHSAQEWLDIFDIFGHTLHTLKFTAFRDADETVTLLRSLQLTYEPPSDSEDGHMDVVEETRNYLPNLKTICATLDLHPDRSRIVLDILCSRRLRPMVTIPSSSPTIMDSDNVTLASISSASSADTSTSIPQQEPSSPNLLSPSLPLPSTSLSPSPLAFPVLDRDPNDYLLDPTPDMVYWSTHTRLEHALIKCWPFGFDFGERERRLAKLLKEDSGLELEVFGQTARVDWL